MTAQKLITYFTFLALLLFTGCKTTQSKKVMTPEEQMFKVAILYPNGEGKTFDLNYYTEKHMPMVADFLGENLKFYEIDKGIAGRTPDQPVPFLAIGYFYVFDVDEYNAAIGQNIETILGDFKNYTNIQPVVQISKIERLSVR